MTAERKRAIYEICCKYDVIIAEGELNPDSCDLS